MNKKKNTNHSLVSRKFFSFQHVHNTCHLRYILIHSLEMLKILLGWIRLIFPIYQVSIDQLCKLDSKDGKK